MVAEWSGDPGGGPSGTSRRGSTAADRAGLESGLNGLSGLVGSAACFWNLAANGRRSPSSSTRLRRTDDPGGEVGAVEDRRLPPHGDLGTVVEALDQLLLGEVVVGVPTDTPASAAIARMVVASSPRSRNNRRAASIIVDRVRALLVSVVKPAGCPTSPRCHDSSSLAVAVAADEPVPIAVDQAGSERAASGV